MSSEIAMQTKQILTNTIGYGTTQDLVVPDSSPKIINSVVISITSSDAFMWHNKIIIVQVNLI